MDIAAFAPAAGQVDFELSLADGATLYTAQAELPYGLSDFAYDLSYDADQVEALQALLREEQEEDEKPIVLEAADNGKYYLPAGTYELKFTLGGEERVVELELK